MNNNNITPPSHSKADHRALIDALQAQANAVQARHLLRFFKTGPGEYGEGDEFLGLRVPQTRATIKPYLTIPLEEVEPLLVHRYHEVRLAGLQIMVHQMMQSVKRAQRHAHQQQEKKLAQEDATQCAILTLYLRHTATVNNWDLVDTSAPRIVGLYCAMHLEELPILFRLAESSLLWEQRIAIVSNWELMRHGIYEPILLLAEQLRHHPHDLMQKANGWMLRELGKYQPGLLLSFLDRYATELPRTMLRYAIERFSDDERRHYMRR